MATGDIGAVIDTLEFDAEVGQFPEIIHISGNIYAIAYGGPFSDGFVCTLSIDTAGNVGAAVIDSLEFDTSACISPKICHISGDVYAIFYEGNECIGIVTVEIDSEGNIGAAVIDSFTSTDTGSNVAWCDPIHVSGDVYAVSYNDNSFQGRLMTVEIDTSGNIGASEIDTFTFDSRGLCTSIVNISGTMYAIAYQGADSDGWISTIVIANDGTIADAVTAKGEFEPTLASYMRMIHIYGNIYGICCAGEGNDGYIKTVTISDAGAISSVIDSLEFDAVKAVFPHMVRVGGSTYAVVYQDTSSYGVMKTFTISSAGAISEVLATSTFDSSRGLEPFAKLIPGSGGILAVAYSGPDTDGFVKTMAVTSDSKGYPVEAITRVTSIVHRFDRGTYTLELGLGEVIADFGLPEWESKPRKAVDDKWQRTEEEIKRLVEEYKPPDWIQKETPDVGPYKSPYKETMVSRITETETGPMTHTPAPEVKEPEQPKEKQPTRREVFEEERLREERLRRLLNLTPGI